MKKVLLTIAQKCAIIAVEIIADAAIKALSKNKKAV